jgi:hypothetical protein
MNTLRHLRKRAIKVLDLPLYETEIYLFIEKEFGELERNIHETFGEKPFKKPKDEAAYGGATLWGFKDEVFRVAIIINEESITWRTIAHEICHAGEVIAHANGWIGDIKSYQEWRADMAGWLAMEVEEAIRKTPGIKIRHERG